jgi:GNAT superfamily N-acetyltransferase
MRASEFIVEYRLSVSKDADGVAVKATAGGKSLGHAEFFFDEEGRLDPQTLWVDERYHGQGIARDMYDHLKDLGYTIVRSWDQTDAGRGFWNKHRGEDARVWEQELSEISKDRLERYLSRATRQVDSRQERMARARQRLSRSYEIYHAEEPTKIVDRFEADTSADAQRYYQDYIERYQSDVDYDLRLRRGTGIMEVTMVNTQSKSKRQHLDVMPNDGRPIPPGEEANYLGKLVAELGDGYQLWVWNNRGTVTYYVFDTDTRTSQLATTGRPYPSNPDSFVIQGVYSGPKNQYRAADLYAFLILDQGLTLISDNKQSEGGYRVWQELERRYGRKLNIHGFDTRTDEPVNVTTQDEPDTHVSRADVKRAGPQMKKELGSISRDLRFVASAR